MKKFRTGFTLIELLVVISIIGILSAIGMTAFTNAQKKARDATRMGDMKAYQSAYEQYYSVNGTNAYGPDCGTMNSYFSSGIAPSDPKPSWANYTSNCVTASYYVCAHLESQTGNATADNGVFGAGGEYFCVKNLQ